MGLLQSRSMFIRDRAALALGDLGNPEAVPLLIDALTEPASSLSTDGSGWAVWGILKALQQLTQQDFGLDSLAWRNWRETGTGRRIPAGEMR